MISLCNDPASIWRSVLGINSVSDVNMLIQTSQTRNMIAMQEAMHEKNIAHIAQNICNSPNIRVVLVTGPSASGKTTFTRKLGAYLRINGIVPVSISLDDYFIDIEHSLRHEDGSFNFEELESLDYNLVNEHIAALISGAQVEIPRFSFGDGHREKEGRLMTLQPGHILLVEGIHALNDRLTHSAADENKFKVYCAPKSSLDIDEQTPVSGADIRLIRRMVRDYNFRYSSAENTFDLWPSVQLGEVKNIFPYESHADVVFDSSMIYELCIFRKYLEPILAQVLPHSAKYALAQKLLELISHYERMDDAKIPSTSLIREFIGGSAYFNK